MISAIQRAFASNLQKVVVKPSERASLEASQIHNPTLQTYLAWRRGVLTFVVISTILSAGLTSYREMYEDDDRVDLIQEVIETAQSHAGGALPIVKQMLESEDEPDDQPGGSGGGSKPGTDSKSTEASTEAAPHKTMLTRFDELIHLIALYLLPVAALAAIFCWKRFQLTFQILIGAFAFSFIMPILLSFCPWSWWEAEATVTKGPLSLLQQAERIADGLIEGFKYLIMLLPTVLSLLPGVQRACVRVKTLFPQSILPGWMLVSASLFFALFLLVICVVVNQILDSSLVVVGMLLVMSSSLYYGINWSVFTRPLVSTEDLQQMFSVRRIAGLLGAVGGCFVLGYLTIHSIMGHPLLGVDPKTAVVIPLDLVELFLETIGRSMFMTAFGADLLLLMNFAAWKSARPSLGSPAAQEYDATMQSLEQAA